MKLKDILKTDNIIKIHPGETISTALSRLSTSHDAAFLFSDDNVFMGMINPYYCLIKSSYPSNAKVEHCIFHPPKIRLNFPLAKVIQLFRESKIHYLPVFDEKDSFIGIISVRRILSHFYDSKIFSIPIHEFLKSKKRPPIVIQENDAITTALATFKKTKVSKLVVVGSDMKLKGILSYYDLISYLVAPMGSAHKGEREGNKIHFHHMKVDHFFKTYVLTLSPNDALSSALRLILEKRIGSVVIIDEERHPIGIITTTDLLTLLLKGEQGERIQIINKNLSQQSRRVLGGFFNRFNLHIKKDKDIDKAKLLVKEEKKGNLFKVVLSLVPKKGTPQIFRTQGKNLLKTLKRILHRS